MKLFLLLLFAMAAPVTHYLKTCTNGSEDVAGDASLISVGTTRRVQALAWTT